MHGLRAKVEAFSKELRNFSQDVAQGVEDIRRAANPEPSTQPAAYCKGVEDKQQQADLLKDDIPGLEGAGRNSSLEELLGHCLTQLEDTNKRVQTLEQHLQGFGYNGVFLTPEKLPSAINTSKDQGMQAEIATPLGGPTLGDNKLKRSFSSPGSLADSVGGSHPASSQLLTITPSPALSSVQSISSMSPGLRELQLKYGQAAGMPSSPPSVQQDKRPATTSTVKSPQRADAGSWIARKLQDKTPSPSKLGSQLKDLTLESRPQSRLKNSSDGQETDGKANADLRSAADEFRPMSTKLLTINTPQRMSMQGDTGSAHSYQSNTPLGKDDVIQVRLANGEAPWDMLSLKAAINNAMPGTGEVQAVIKNATFHPQAAAFTSLLHMCAKNKLWEKALEVFEGMKKYYPGVSPNTVHFSSLISACGTAGRWREAMQVFEDMKAHSQKDKQCTPNVITYSALMTACCSGGRPDKAHQVFNDMIAQGIKPDHISYSTLIAGYERWGDMETAIKLFDDMKAAGLCAKPFGPQSYLEQFSRKIRRTNSSISVEEQGPDLMSLKKLDPTHRPWGSFGSGSGTDSPQIGAHFPGAALARNISADMTPGDDTMTLRRDVLHTRSPTQRQFPDIMPAPGLSHNVPGLLAPQNSPMAAPQRHSAHVGGGHLNNRIREMGRSPLSQSYDASRTRMPAHLTNMLAPPPGFPAHSVPPTSLEPTRSFTTELQRQLGSGDISALDFAATPIAQRLAHTSSLNGSSASQMLDALVQQQMASQPLMSGQAGMTPQTFLQKATKAANGAPQIPQVTVEEYNNLPLRFSRQLSLDQMNEAVDYINALVEGKHPPQRSSATGGRLSATSGPETEGVSPAELIPLQLGGQRTTALLNCLLQLKRLRLSVHDGQQLYVLSSAN